MLSGQKNKCRILKGNKVEEGGTYKLVYDVLIVLVKTLKNYSIIY